MISPRRSRLGLVAGPPGAATDTLRAAVEFRLLGPFEAYHDGRRIEVGTRRQERCLLAVLLLRAGQLVPFHRILDLLWDGEPPRSARRVVHTYVGRLRRSLAPCHVRIVTGHDGYRLEPDRHRIDAAEFTAAVRLAVEQRSPYHRARLLDDALALWRGPLLADLAGQRLADRLGVELAELRISSMELRAEAQLEIGQHDRVVADLMSVVERHPTRERLTALLMTGMQRCGRPGDALRRYRVTRTVLTEELGIEPGAELQRLHQRILRSDPAPTPRPPRPVYEVRVRGQDLPWAVGGHPALEFCNTWAGWRRPPQPGSEWLRGYDTLAVWAGYLDLIDKDTVTYLLGEAHRFPDQAAVVLDEARTLRSNLYTCLTRPDETAAFRVVAGFVEAAVQASRLRLDDTGLARWVLPAGSGLRLPLHAAARAAGDLLADPRRHTIRACPSDSCGWLFLDRTGLRRWCSTAACGIAEGCREAVG